MFSKSFGPKHGVLNAATVNQDLDAAAHIPATVRTPTNIPGSPVTRRPNSPSKNPAIPPGNRLVTWTGFAVTVRSFQFVGEDSGRMRVVIQSIQDRQSELDQDICRKEEDLYLPFAENITTPVVNILKMLREYQHLRCFHFGDAGVSELGLLKPDALFVLNKVAKLSIEIKHMLSLISWVNDTGNNRIVPSNEIVNILQLQDGQHPLGEDRLMTLYNHRSEIANNAATHPADGLYHAINQIYGYMTATNNPYGVLSTYEMSWFLSAVHTPGSVAISPAVMHNATSPTLLRCIAFMIVHGSSGQWEPQYGEPPSGDGEVGIVKSPPETSEEESSYKHFSSKVSAVEGKMVLRSHKRARNGDAILSDTILCDGTVPHTAVSSPSAPGSPTEFNKHQPFNWSCDCATFFSRKHPVVGRGASGEVVLWKKPERNSLYPLDDVLAVKRCSFYEPDQVIALRKESHIYRKLSHLQMHDLSQASQTRFVPCIWHEGQIGPYYCLIMTYLGDRALNLGKWLKTNPDASRQQLINRRLCLALTMVHEADVLHGDIRYQNIFVLESDQVVLIDFAYGTESSSTQEKSSELTKAKLLFDATTLNTLSAW